MVINPKGILLLILLAANAVLLPQAKVSEQNKELDKLKTEIRQLERDISKAKSEEKKTYELIQKLNRRNYLLSRLVGNLRSEHRRLQEQIDTTEAAITQLEKEIKALKDNYARSVKAMYKNSFKSKWRYVLDSESFQAAILRYKYFESFSARRKKDFAELKTKSEELLALRSSLGDESNKKQIIIAEKDKEEQNLRNQIGEKTRTLTEVRNDKKNLEKELDEKRVAEKKIKRMIEDLIAKEIENKRRQRLEEEEARRRTAAGKEAQPPIKERSWVETDGSVFARLKGRLNWPVSAGRIIRGSGESKNKELNTVTLSYGVDIKTTGSASVKTVADGVVSAVDYVPGFGSIVIVSHAGDYRTVYGHLSEINVRENDRVKAGASIGTVGESLEGYVLHFQIWKERSYLKPETWLSSR
ncbi:MAG: peptidoglycan DD-metalloendopeptidase family protein [Ignavibacteriaceae bacterium]|nr:peptidoglycan DD-metalloendopeptidase family protein [Ignavibacteriaceae bacterium]